MLFSIDAPVEVYAQPHAYEYRNNFYFAKKKKERSANVVWQYFCLFVFRYHFLFCCVVQLRQKKRILIIILYMLHIWNRSNKMCMLFDLLLLFGIFFVRCSSVTDNRQYTTDFIILFRQRFICLLST